MATGNLRRKLNPEKISMPELIVPKDAKESYDEWVDQQAKKQIVNLSPECLREIEASNNNPVPWICRGCPKTLQTCGKSVGECENSLWRINEYERSWGRS